VILLITIWWLFISINHEIKLSKTYVDEEPSDPTIGESFKEWFIWLKWCEIFDKLVKLHEKIMVNEVMYWEFTCNTKI